MKKEIIYGSAISFALLAIGFTIWFFMRKKDVVESTNYNQVLQKSSKNLVLSDNNPFNNETNSDINPESIEIITSPELPPVPLSITDIAPEINKMEADYGKEYRKRVMKELAVKLQGVYNNTNLSFEIQRNYAPYSDLLVKFLGEVDKQTAIDTFLSYS